MAWKKNDHRFAGGPDHTVGHQRAAICLLRGIKQAKRKEIEVLSHTDIGLSDDDVGVKGSLSRVRRMVMPAKGQAEIIEGTSAEKAARISCNRQGTTGRSTRMSGLLVIAEHRQGELTPASLECISAAAALRAEKDQPIAVAVLASNPDQYSTQLNLGGVDEVVRITTPDDEFQVDTYEAAIGALIDTRQPAVVLMPHSVDAWGYAPVVAAPG